jgi:hypothetical protein
MVHNIGNIIGNKVSGSQAFKLPGNKDTSGADFGSDPRLCQEITSGLTPDCNGKAMLQCTIPSLHFL